MSLWSNFIENAAIIKRILNQSKRATDMVYMTKSIARKEWHMNTWQELTITVNEAAANILVKVATWLTPVAAGGDHWWQCSYLKTIRGQPRGGAAAQAASRKHGWIQLPHLQYEPWNNQDRNGAVNTARRWKAWQRDLDWERKPANYSAASQRKIAALQLEKYFEPAHITWCNYCAVLDNGREAGQLRRRLSSWTLVWLLLGTHPTTKMSLFALGAGLGWSGEKSCWTWHWLWRSLYC